jgi:PAS domain S-box-containing protein
MQSLTDELQSRRTLRDIVALFSLPSIWVDNEPVQVAESLADVLLNTLPLDFVYLRLRREARGDEPEVVRTARLPTVAGQAREIGQSLAPWLNNGDTNLLHTIPNPMGGGMVRLLRAPLGTDGGEGVVVAGSQQADFPSEVDRLLLSVGASQAGAVLRRSRAEQELRDSEERFRQLAENIDGYFWLNSPDDNQMLYMSRGYEKICGRTCESLYRSPESWSEIIHPDDRERVWASLLEPLSDSGRQIEYRIVRPDGAVRWIRDRAFPVRDASGEVCRVAGIGEDITERKSAEQALRENEERVRLLLNSTSEAIYGVDLDGICTFCNPACLRLLGYSDQRELLGKNMHELIFHKREDGTLYRREDGPIARALGYGEPAHSQNEILWRADHTSFHAEYWSHPVRRGNEIVGAVVTFVDISERRRSEEQLRNSQSQFAEAQRLANIGSWTWNIANNQVLWSDEHYRIYGLEPHAIPVNYDEVMARIHPDDRALLKNRVAQVFRDHQPFECAVRILRPDRTIRVIKSLGQVILDNDDKPTRMFGTSQDITEQCHAEHLIRESEERFRAICDQAVVGIAQVDLTGRFLFVNDRYLHTLGYTRTELMQMRMQEITHPADLPANLVQFHALAEGGPDFLFEKRSVRKDGSVLWVKSHVNGLRDLSGNVTSIVMVSVDITEQRQQEEALRASEARYRIFVDHATNGLFLHDGEGRVVDVNRHACESLGYSRQELIGKTPAAFDPDITPEIMAYRTSRLVKGETLAFDARQRRKDGSTFPVEVRVRPFEVDGQFYALSLAHDITERMKTEEALRNYAKQLRNVSQHMIDIQEEERRHLARELHDEIGQILSAIGVNLHALNTVSDAASRPRLEESIGIVDLAIQQVHDLSLDLRPSMLDDLGLVSTIRWFVDRLAQRTGLELEFIAESSGDRLPADLEIACYRVAQEALTNVVRHAQARHVRVEFRQQEEDVQLVIRDDGVGFNLDAIKLGATRGTSFGLLGMEERVELLGGQIEFTSHPGHGTGIQVSFPLSSQLAIKAESQTSV